MARFKITPVNLKNGSTAPYSIQDLDENRNVESQADEVTHLVKRFPEMWSCTTSKLSPCKSDMQRGR